MNNKILFEVCCGHLADVIICQQQKVQRIELNVGLSIGGLTPSYGLAVKAREVYDGKIVAMLRTRAGGFTYNEDELQVIAQDIKALMPYVDGFVFGCLDDNQQIDVAMLKKVRQWTKGKELAFHRAFDLVSDYKVAIEQLIDCNVERVLTSGLAFDCQQGIDTLKEMQIIYGKRIEILAGGGIDENNVVSIATATDVEQFHGSLRKFAYNYDSSDYVSYAFLPQKNHYDCLDGQKLARLLKNIA